VIGALARAVDLAFGQGDEHVLRSCLLAVRLARRAGLPDDELAEVFSLAQLRYVGCTGHAHEVSQLVGDEISARGHSLTQYPASSGRRFSGGIRE
jgi:hypothetical protein